MKPEVVYQLRNALELSTEILFVGEASRGKSGLLFIIASMSARAV